MAWEGNIENLVLALKDFCPEVTQIISAHVSLAGASHTAMF